MPTSHHTVKSQIEVFIYPEHLQKLLFSLYSKTSILEYSWSAANGIPKSRWFWFMLQKLISVCSKTHSRIEVIPESSISGILDSGITSILEWVLLQTRISEILLYKFCKGKFKIRINFTQTCGNTDESNGNYHTEICTGIP